MHRTTPTTTTAPTARRRPLKVAATTILARYGLGLLGLATTALFAALILTACGSTDVADRRAVDSPGATSPLPQITSEAMALPPAADTSGPAPADRSTSAAAPDDLVATVDDLSWNLDENPFQVDWSDEEKEQWRRSLYIYTRFEVINTFLAANQLDHDEVIAAVGPTTTCRQFVYT